MCALGCFSLGEVAPHVLFEEKEQGIDRDRLPIPEARSGVEKNSKRIGGDGKVVMGKTKYLLNIVLII
jgi:hypothetical protein